jgi:uncharacterized protein
MTGWKHDRSQAADTCVVAINRCSGPPRETPPPLNPLTNIPLVEGNHVEMRLPVSTPGSYVPLRAEMVCIVAFSARPQDLLPINGPAMRPTEVHIELLD